MSSAQIETLERLLSQGTLAVGDLKVALMRLSAEVTDRTAKGSSASYDFFVGVVEAVSKVKGVTHADIRLSCLFDSSVFFYRSGFARAALETSDSVYKLARRIDSKPWMRKASTLAGIVHSEAGSVSEAVMHYCDALGIARELRDDESEVLVLINLGAAFNYASLYHEGIRCLSRAIGLCGTASLGKYVAVAYCDLAQAYLALEEFHLGFEAITRSLVASEEPDDGSGYFSRTIREYTYVQLALEVGKLARAREHAAACWSYSQWGNNSRCRTLAEIATGLCEIRGGDVQKGLNLLEKSLATSGEFVVSRIDALNALVKAYDEVGKPERALHYMQELLSFVRATRGQSLEAAMSIPNGVSNPSLVSDGNRDVRALELREARLRAKVAEREVINSRLEMLERMAITADLKEEESGQHGYRVGRLAGFLAARLGYDDEVSRAIEVGARLHDIGKIGVPDRILLSPNTLKEAERHFMSAHTLVGAEILGKSQVRHLQLAEEIARHHHECWDGTGYPSKLSGKRIPIHARIVALADVFDALTHGRPYAPAWPIDRAIEEIRNRRGTQFDPELTDTFLELIDELRRKHSDLDAFLGEAGRNSPFLQARDRIRLMLEGERRAENIAAVAAETVH